MRLVTYADASGPRTGVVIDDLVVDLAASASEGAAPPGGVPSEGVIELLRRGPAGLDAVRSTVAAAERRGADALLASGAASRLDAVRLLPPIRQPGKVIALGLNYRAHAEESEMATPAAPEVFTKYATSFIGAGATIEIPEISEQVDYEIELGVVIGAPAKSVSVSEALAHVAGYTIVNDVSIRDYQNLTSQWTVGKSFDRSSPVGPWIVTADEIPDPQRLELELSVNGEVLQAASTSTMIFSVAEIVSRLSRVMTLLPGDLIATGTPAGVGVARRPPRWLRRGDTVVARIEGVGVLANPVGAATAGAVVLP